MAAWRVSDEEEARRSKVCTVIRLQNVFEFHAVFEVFAAMNIQILVI
jgi:hypothetical protein